jgi:transposase, IS5 family
METFARKREDDSLRDDESGDWVMAQRRIGQLGLLDASLARRGEARRDVLNEIGKLLDWSPFERALSKLYTATKGESPYPPLMMFKVLLLQRWHDLSDPQMEVALFDRLSFQRFAGLSLDDETPDHTTIWRFRQKLDADGLIELLMAELTRQLDQHGLLIKQGTLIDASLVASAARRPRMDEGRESAVDPDARFGTGNDRGRFTFGYKMHVAVDQGSGLVRVAQLTPANIQEVSVACELVPQEAGTVYGDRGYDSAAFHAHLAACGCGDGVMRRGHKNQPLAPAQVERNHALSLTRRAVESLFGTLKRSYGFTRMRFYNAERNTVAFLLVCMAFNLKRWNAIVTG